LIWEEGFGDTHGWCEGRVVVVEIDGERDVNKRCLDAIVCLRERF